MKKGLKFILAGAAGALPFVAFAQNIADIVVQLTGIINVIIPFIVGLAVLVIIWGVFGYISGADDEEKRSEAKQYIIWGVIGVFIMLSIWGLVNVLVSSFNLNKAQPASPSVGEIEGVGLLYTQAQRDAAATCGSRGYLVNRATGAVTCR